jgi:DDE superfamily endonuclease
VPGSVQSASKTDLARLMPGRALDAGAPAAWVTADEAYGKDGRFRDWLKQRRAAYVVAVASNQAVPGSVGTSRADVLAAHAPDQAWKRRSCGNGAKGPGSSTGPPRPAVSWHILASGKADVLSSGPSARFRASALASVRVIGKLGVSFALRLGVGGPPVAVPTSSRSVTAECVSSRVNSHQARCRNAGSTRWSARRP